VTFHYPNGIPYNHHEAQSPKKQVKKKRPVEFGNRGMDFEEAINQSNQYYLLNKQAVVHKKPTPVRLLLRRPTLDKLQRLIITVYIKAVT